MGERKMAFTGNAHLDRHDYWDGLKRDRAVEDVKQVALNEHQFGDQGTLFHAPLGQPEMGTTNGNPHARLYRTVQVPNHLTSAEDVLKYASRPGKDSGHDRTLGIHWTHRLDETQNLGHEVQDGNWGRHGDSGHAVIIEADHPGLDHIIPRTPGPGGGPPEGVSGGSSRNNRLTGEKKDWALIHDTVGPHDMDKAMLPEVPVRPGAPMQVHAVHFPDPKTSGAYLRNPVQFKGQA